MMKRADVALACALMGVLAAFLTGCSALGAGSGVARHVDAEECRRRLVETVDLWNGGLDGKSGMGVYREDWDGLFKVHLDRQFQFYESDIPYFRNSTVIAQSRAIYMNAAACFAAPEDDKDRFKRAVLMGADYLLEYGRDPRYGGYFWRLDYDGDVPPDGNEDSTLKDTYGNTFLVFGLANAWRVSKEEKYLNAAMEQIELLYERFADPKHPGGFLPPFSRTWDGPRGVKHFDPPVHLLEALMVLHDHTSGATRRRIEEWIKRQGDFVTEVMYQDLPGHEDRGFVAEVFADNWKPHPDQVEVRGGHCVETAFLLGRAVERGLGDESWLEVARKIMTFAVDTFYDESHGAVLDSNSDYHGDVVDGDVAEWWHNTEMARAAAHFSAVHGMDYGEVFRKVDGFIRGALTDQRYGGLYIAREVLGREPGNLQLQLANTDKGHVWKVNYHHTMYLAELLRLEEKYGGWLF